MADYLAETAFQVEDVFVFCFRRFSVWSLGFMNLGRTTWVEEYVAKTAHLQTERKKELGTRCLQ